jgi:hypothetical protein
LTAQVEGVPVVDVESIGVGGPGGLSRAALEAENAALRVPVAELVDRVAGLEGKIADLGRRSLP